MPKCEASTKRGGDCRQNVVEKTLYCTNHQSEESRRAPKISVKIRKGPQDVDEDQIMEPQTATPAVKKSNSRKTRVAQQIYQDY